MDTEKAISVIFWLILGIGIGVTTLIFMVAISGSVYQTTEADISNLGNNIVKSDSFIASNLSTNRLDHSWIQSGSLSIKNGTTTGQDVGLGNFTIDYDAGTILLKSTATEVTYNGSTMYANYTWGITEIRTSISNSIISGFDTQEKTAKYMPLVVLAIVILIIILSLPFINKGGQEGSPL